MKSGICLQNILRYRFPQGTINPKHSMERTDEIGRDCLERLLNVNIVRDSFVGGGAKCRTRSDRSSYWLNEGF